MGEAYVQAKRARNGKLAAPKFSWASTLNVPHLNNVNNRKD